MADSTKNEAQGNNPEITLNTYFLEEIACKMNTAFDPKKPINWTGLKVGLEGGASEDGLNRTVKLYVKQVHEKDGNYPYQFNVVMTALYEVNKKFIEITDGKEKAEMIVARTAYELLYPAVRELLVILSGHSPAGNHMKIMLPPISFEQLGNNQKEK